VAHKTHIGGPAPKAVEADLLAIRERLARKRGQIAKRRKAIEQAKAKLAKAVEGLVGEGKK
jgi:hypothetical protein